MKGLEVVVAIRVYRRLDNNFIKRIVKAIAKNKDRRRKEELLIEKDVDGEEYPSYLSTKLEGMNFIVRYLGWKSCMRAFFMKAPSLSLAYL